MILMRCRGKPAKAEPAATEDLTEESPCRARAVVAVCTEGEQAILARKTFWVLILARKTFWVLIPNSLATQRVKSLPTHSELPGLGRPPATGRQSIPSRRQVERSHQS